MKYASLDIYAEKYTQIVGQKWELFRKSIKITNNIHICKKICSIQQLKGITFFAFCNICKITRCFFLSGYIWLKYWNVIPSMCLIRSRNQNDWTNFHPLFPGFDVWYGLGNILYSSSLINCGYLVVPMVEPYIDNDIVRLFIYI